jgi:hypothetical protein
MNLIQEQWLTYFVPCTTCNAPIKVKVRVKFQYWPDKDGLVRCGAAVDQIDTQATYDHTLDHMFNSEETEDE